MWCDRAKKTIHKQKVLIGGMMGSSMSLRSRSKLDVVLHDSIVVGTTVSVEDFLSADSLRPGLDRPTFEDIADTRITRDYEKCSS